MSENQYHPIPKFGGRASQKPCPGLDPCHRLSPMQPFYCVLAPAVFKLTIWSVTLGILLRQLNIVKHCGHEPHNQVWVFEVRSSSHELPRILQFTSGILSCGSEPNCRSWLSKLLEDWAERDQLQSVTWESHRLSRWKSVNELSFHEHDMSLVEPQWWHPSWMITDILPMHCHVLLCPGAPAHLQKPRPLWLAALGYCSQ